MMQSLPTFLANGLGGTSRRATAMVLWPLTDRPNPKACLDFNATLATMPAVIAKEIHILHHGTQMVLRRLQGPKCGPLVEMIHGSVWQGMQLEGLGSTLAQTADVRISDLRGPGEARPRRRDVACIGQVEGNLADLIKARAKPGQKAVLLGHSSGGGLVVRFAGGAARDLIAGAVLAV